MAKYWIRIPNLNHSRPGFRIIKDGKTYLEPRLKAINEALKTQALDYSNALENVRSIVSELRHLDKPDRTNYADQNLDVLSKAIGAYQDRTDIRDRSRRMAVAGLRRSCDLLGPHVIFTVTVDTIQKSLDRERPEARPKLALYLNILLKHAGWVERLKVPSQPDPDIRYLNASEFNLMLKNVPPDLQGPVEAAYATGGRLGEVFALSRIGRKSSVWIEQQMYPELQEGRWYGPCKWRKKRWAPVMQSRKANVTTWVDRLNTMPENDKQALRALAWGDIVRDACKLTFPDRPSKHLNFRDIRHCYAIYWLDKGATLRHVAQSMGNSEKVVLKHYSGFVQTDEAELVMLALEG